MSEAPGALQRPAKLFQVIFIMDESAVSQISFGGSGTRVTFSCFETHSVVLGFPRVSH